VAVNENSEDGILSAKEICELDLSNVEFVVLSACQTAKGDVMDDGTAGLVRGLKSAGVKSILATLWSINDNSALLFMQEFHKQLSNGKTPYEAMKSAQNSLMKTKHVVYRRKFSAKTLASDRENSKEELDYNRPYHYAPFILIDAIE
jgi:CHAT domain-containing protein